MPNSSPRPQPQQSFIGSWALVGGFVAVFVSAALLFVFAWMNGLTYNPAGLGGNRPKPMSPSAAGQAFELVFVIEVYLGLPFFVVGAVVGAVAALVKRARGRKQTPGSPAAEPDAAK